MGYLLTIKLDTESIVEMLKEHATDWQAVLYFIQSCADSFGHEIETKEIYGEMKKFYYEGKIND